MGTMKLTICFAGKRALFAIGLKIVLRDFGNDLARFLRSALLIWSGPSALLTSNFKIAVLFSLGET